MTRRAFAFMIVGAGGFVVQLMVVTVSTTVFHWPVPIATAIAVEAAVLTNFCWHERWTWRDRRGTSGWAARLVRFHAANGAASLAGNIVITTLAVRALDMRPAIANTLAVGLLAAFNYVTADRWVFARRAAMATSLLALG